MYRTYGAGFANANTMEPGGDTCDLDCEIRMFQSCSSEWAFKETHDVIKCSQRDR